MRVQGGREGGRAGKNQTLKKETLNDTLESRNCTACNYKTHNICEIWGSGCLG